MTIEGCRAVKRTALALLVRLPDDREFWFPQSVIEQESEVYDARTMEHREPGVLVISDSFAEKLGLDRKPKARARR